MRGLAFASRLLERSLTEMSVAQLRILSFVARDPVRASALAQGTALSKPTVSGLLDALVSKGWLVRTTVDSDRRGVSLSITRAGSRALTAARRESQAALSHVLDDLEPDEREATIGALAGLADLARKRADTRAKAAG